MKQEKSVGYLFSVLKKIAESRKQLEEYEYLLHHIEKDGKGNETIHHCLVYDHLANMFEQEHLVVSKGKVRYKGKVVEDGVYHVIAGLESTQDICWSNEEAEENKITPKGMTAGMKFKQKAKEW
uniref:Uncharacterized protein n=1 Tax=viral metagenome TaxID=1070528 RepID=A0A6M3K3Z6_9ZZZZ